MRFNQFNNKGQGNQGDIHKTPENARERPFTLQRKQTVVINGQPVPLSKTAYEKDGNGEYIEVSEVQTITAADGRILTPTDFGGISWTGLPVPRDRMGECLNPFGHHQHRPVYLGIDSLVTELGNVLCNECVEHNYNRYKKARRWYLRLFLNPTIY